MSNAITKECSICNDTIDVQTAPDGTIYWTDGHNAQPVTDGRCCTSCNYSAVIPARLLYLAKSTNKKSEVSNEH